MSTDVTEVQSGLEGVVAFATEIAEPDREGGALRYRGVDIEELVGSRALREGLGPARRRRASSPACRPPIPHPLTIRSGDPRVDVQSALATLAPQWGFRQLIDISDEQARDDLARASVMALSFVAQSARGVGRPPVPQTDVDLGATHRRALPHPLARRGDPDHVKAIDAYWISAAEHGMNASTFTARVVASTGADCAAALSSAVGALSGPLHGGAPVARAEDARRGRAARRRRALGQGRAGPRRAAHGLRAPRLSRRGSAGARPAAHGARAGLDALRGGRGARARGARRAAGAQARSRPGHQRRVLVGRRARPGRGAAGALHEHVHLRARGGLVGAHPRAEARGAADQARRRSTSARRPGRPPSWGKRRTTSPGFSASRTGGRGRAAGSPWQGRHVHRTPRTRRYARMRMLRLVVPAMVASAVLASAASAASTQQAAKDRFAQDAQGVRVVSAPATAAASTVTGTVSAKRLGVSSNATAGSAGPRGRRPLRGAARRHQRELAAALRAGDDRRPRPAPRALRPGRRRRAGLRRRRHRRTSRAATR